MVEHTRRHERLVERPLGGTTRSYTGPLNKPVELWIPPRVASATTFDVVIHFHGAAWLAQQAVSEGGQRAVAAVLNLGSGSGVYDRTFNDPAVFDSLLAAITREVRSVHASIQQVRRITLVGFSAGHGSVRAILRHAPHAERVDAVLLIDGLHTSYVPEGKPLASGGVLDTTNLVALTNFAREAMLGRKRMLITHSEIFPGTFASTTETTDWMVSALGVRRTPVLRWGARGLQQLSEVRAGKLRILGFAGNSAPDHVDQLHAMPELLGQLGAGRF